MTRIADLIAIASDALTLGRAAEARGVIAESIAAAVPVPVHATKAGLLCLPLAGGGGLFCHVHRWVLADDLPI